jgi:hypothetical protein
LPPGAAERELADGAMSDSSAMQVGGELDPGEHAAIGRLGREVVVADP